MLVQPMSNVNRQMTITIHVKQIFFKKFLTFIDYFFIISWKKKYYIEFFSEDIVVIF